jgi:D-sedoheptulose 7-phosphate isomerase
MPSEFGTLSPTDGLQNQSAVTAIHQAIQASITAQHALLGQSKLLLQIAEHIAAALHAGHKVLAFGNGGSAAQAQHLVGELVGRFGRERRALAAVALGADPTVLTALANDYGYSAVFQRQLEALGDPGDVAVALSTSGMSPNVVQALQTARTFGLLIIGFTGDSGGRIAESADFCLQVASTETARIQEAHLLAIHVVCEQVEEILFGR